MLPLIMLLARTLDTMTLTTVILFVESDNYVERRAIKLESHIKRGRHGTSYLNRVRDDIRFI